MCKNNEDALVQCPYYKDEQRQIIHCEGVEDGTGLHLGFSNRGRLLGYKDRFCRNCWDQCMIAKMLNLKYDYVP